MIRDRGWGKQIYHYLTDSPISAVVTAKQNLETKTAHHVLRSPKYWNLNRECTTDNIKNFFLLNYGFFRCFVGNTPFFSVVISFNLDLNKRAYQGLLSRISDAKGKVSGEESYTSRW
ncbi:hypothetical protein LSM04_008526 [Trypanosoma melophagium]|uniref:uncharacterized protein n=1 Tax=Trypanosoma melophagium TaxID=715481 RepID=UPI00351A3F3E|nr:hypothetical protein LSM04_008526 [Trypanosoma melophagium]